MNYKDKQITCPVCETDNWKLFICKWTSSIALGIECSQCGHRTNEFFDSKVKDLCERLKLKSSDDKNKGGELIPCPNDGSETWKLSITDTHIIVSCASGCYVDNATTLDSNVGVIWQLIEDDKK